MRKTLAAIPEKEMVSLENQWRQKPLGHHARARREGLAAHYEFEGNLTDTSGHGLDAKAARGDVVYDDGAVGKAAEFSGETQVDFAEAPATSIATRPFALAFWASPDGTKGLDLIQKRDASPNWRGYEITIDDPTFRRSATTPVPRLRAAREPLARRRHRGQDEGPRPVQPSTAICW